MLGTLTTHKEQGDSQRSELYISQFTCELIKLFHAILKILLVFFHVGIFSLYELSFAGIWHSWLSLQLQVIFTAYKTQSHR